MLTDKELKKKFIKEVSKDPDKYYATKVLKQHGYQRSQCKTCKKFFWSINPQQTCGDASCQGGFTFLNNSSKPLTYIQVWKEFEKLFKSYDYTSINRYPVVARWNPTTEFTIASIAAFQPFVINGESEPPAEKLVIPQFCLRFGDLANVGVTMSHMTGFVMIGQHQFTTKENWDQDKAFEEILTWITKGLNLKKEDVIFHEDAWAGGGNYGPCMEFFSSGVELGNQVYMMYEQGPNEERNELTLKVLDMGMGMERNAWFSQKTPTIYDATFPQVISKLIKQTNVHYDKEFMLKYVPYGAYLNLDEVENIHEAWKQVAKKMGVSIEVLKQKLEPMTAIYSIAEHTRSLLFAISDGMLPSNVGGGYNLRTILRRALSFIEKFEWNIDLTQVCRWHAEELKDLFPELLSNINDIEKILNIEKQKFYDAKKRNHQIITNEFNKNMMISTERLLQLYDSYGITPEELKKEAPKTVELDVPENFYSLISEYHEKKEKVVKGTNHDKLINTENIPPTEVMYYNDWEIKEFTATVLKVEKNIFVLLDKTAFYPTSGGQQHDTGTINGKKLLECVKQGKHIVHIVEGANFKPGDTVVCEINLERRKQLTQHHTATHVINGVAKKILGEHVWQAGASKSVKKARLDITHFESLTEEQLAQIEKEANEIIKQGIPIKKSLMPRAKAEKQFGFKLYQGGAVPGTEIRVVQIEGLDIEACGGTHLNNTSEIEQIKVLKSSKVQDGTIRIEFVAGKAASSSDTKESQLIIDAAKLLNCTPKQVPCRAEELFTKWKKAKKSQLLKKDFDLLCTKETTGDPLTETANILKTQPEHIVNTLTKFLNQYGSLKRIAK